MREGETGLEEKAAAAPRRTSFEEFWPFYVSQHSRPSTRALHFAGTTMVLGSLAAGLVVAPAWALLAPLVGYGPAWIGHFFCERNRPATFTYPLWSLRADFRMFRLMLTGRMAPEVERARRAHHLPT
jgi:hypothetical protein